MSLSLTALPSVDDLEIDGNLERGTFQAVHAMIGCGRDGLHMCRVNSIPMLMQFWPAIRRGLLQIRRKNRPLFRWLPDHVLREIQKGLLNQSSTECFLAHDGTEETVHGFIVVYPLIDPFVQLPLRLYVWMLAAEAGVMRQLIDELDAICLERGLHGWQMQSPRRGWIRRAPQIGAHVVEYTIAKDLIEDEQ